MRILLVSGSFPPMKCGVGDYTASLAASLARRAEHSVGVLTSEGAGLPPVPGVQLLPVVRGWNLRDAPHIARVLRKWRPDIVHIQFPTLVYGKIQWLLPAIARALNGPVVQTWHEYHPKGSLPNLPNALLPGGLVVVRPDYVKTMPSWYRRCLAFKKIEFIPNASSIPAVTLSGEERDAILERWGLRPGRAVAYFGFASPAKGIDLLFDIADPAEHRLVLICDLDPSDGYHRTILKKAGQPPWAGKVRITGFLESEDAGRVLAASDAAVFPFRDGGGGWNTSLHGAMAQGTFVLTTSREKNGYFPGDNVYYARALDAEEMRAALKSHIGERRPPNPSTREWDGIAGRHVRLYESLVA